MSPLFFAARPAPKETLNSICSEFCKGDSKLLDALSHYINLRREMGKPVFPTQLKSRLDGIYREANGDMKRILKAVEMAVERGWVQIHVDAIPEERKCTKNMSQEELAAAISLEEF